jgi:hypothetical protein
MARIVLRSRDPNVLHPLAAMAVLRRIGGANGFQRNVARIASAASRLLRAYTTQVESLRRLRSGGSQFVRAEHVHVNEGGQAVIVPLPLIGRGLSNEPARKPTIGNLPSYFPAQNSMALACV